MGVFSGHISLKEPLSCFMLFLQENRKY
jgi:hypothetical protein